MAHPHQTEVQCAGMGVTTRARSRPIATYDLNRVPGEVFGHPLQELEESGMEHPCTARHLHDRVSGMGVTRHVHVRGDGTAHGASVTTARAHGDDIVGKGKPRSVGHTTQLVHRRGKIHSEIALGLCEQGEGGHGAEGGPAAAVGERSLPPGGVTATETTHLDGGT